MVLGTRDKSLRTRRRRVRPAHTNAYYTCVQIRSGTHTHTHTHMGARSDVYRSTVLNSNVQLRRTRARHSAYSPGQGRRVGPADTEAACVPPIPPSPTEGGVFPLVRSPAN